jgi:hypothetical protein
VNSWAVKLSTSSFTDMDLCEQLGCKTHHEQLHTTLSKARLISVPKLEVRN